MTTLIKQRSPNAGESLMGLEQLNYVMFPDCDTILEIPIINNKHNLGLTSEQQAEFENYFGVKFDTLQGREFLNNYQIVLRHDVNPRDHKKMDHLFDLAILKANGGMGMVQFEDSKDQVARFPFIATDEAKELEKTVSKKKLRNIAIEELNKLAKHKNTLLKITKFIFDLNQNNLDENSAYDRLDDYINGGQAEKFLTVIKLDPDYIDTVVSVKEAMIKGIIRLGQDQWYVNHANQTKLGRNIEEIVNYLNNPQNQDQIGTGAKDDLPYAIKRQLKESLN